LHAIGIGNAVDASTLNAFDSAAHARILSDTGQLTTALVALAHSGFGAVLPEPPAESPPEAFPDHAAAPGTVEDAPHHHAAPGEAGEPAASFRDDGPFSELGAALGDNGSESFFDASFPPAPQAQAAVVRHFSPGSDRLDLYDLFGANATVEYLLPRIATSRETRTVNEKTVEDLVLHIHAGDGAITPVVRTIVLEGFMQAHPEAPENDLQALLQYLLHPA
jgi:hypothetical protein